MISLSSVSISLSTDEYSIPVQPAAIAASLKGFDEVRNILVG
jgi:hypothetical protein